MKLKHIRFSPNITQKVDFRTVKTAHVIPPFHQGVKDFT